MRFYLIILFFVTNSNLFAQAGKLSLNIVDTAVAPKPVGLFAFPKEFNKKRFKTVAIGSTALWLGTMYILNDAWYKNYPKQSFHLYNDFGEWKHIDKAGHVYSSYLGTKLFTNFYRWSGINERKAIWLGVGSGMAYMSIIEILDGYSDKWGFSMPDMIANGAGAGLYAAQQIYWKEQRIKLKFGSHIKEYNEVQLLKRVNDLYGATTLQRLLKDYNGQTYWASINVRSFLPQTKWPHWLNIAIGYGAGNMYGGYSNTWVDANGNKISRNDQVRYNQFFITPDIDFSKIPFKNKHLRTFFKAVNLRAPIPALEFNTLNQVKINYYDF